MYRSQPLSPQEQWRRDQELARSGMENKMAIGGTSVPVVPYATGETAPTAPPVEASTQTRRTPPSAWDQAKDKLIDTGIKTGVKELGREAGHQIAGGAPTVTGVMPDGNVAMSDGSIVKPDGTFAKEGSYASKGAEYAGYAIAAYNAYKALSGNGSTGEKALGVGQAGLGAAQTYFSGTSAAPYLSAVNGAINVGRTVFNDNMSAEDRATRAQQQVGLAFADYFTYGGASLAEGLARKNKTTGKLLGKVDAFDQKTNPMTWALAKGIKFTGGKKGEDQQQRDQIRKYLKENGFLGDPKDEDWNLENADGSSFDIGKDGGARLADGRKYFETDPKTQAAASTSVEPLAILLTGGNEKLAPAFTGYLANTVTAGAGATDVAVANANVLDKYKKAGFTSPDKALLAIDEMAKAGKIPPEKVAALKTSVTGAFNFKAPPPAGTPGQRPATTAQMRTPTKAAPRRRRGGGGYTPQEYTPQTYAPQVAAPSSNGYSDFAQGLANVYQQNQIG